MKKKPIVFDQTKGEDVIDGMQRSHMIADPMYMGGRRRGQKKRSNRVEDFE